MNNKGILKINRKKLNLSGFQEIDKSYQEGIYSDSPANRKLGRVGMSYKQYSDKLSGKEDNENNEDKKEKSGVELFNEQKDYLRSILKHKRSKERDVSKLGIHYRGFHVIAVQLGRMNEIALKTKHNGIVQSFVPNQPRYLSKLVEKLKAEGVKAPKERPHKEAPMNDKKAFKLIKEGKLDYKLLKNLSPELNYEAVRRDGRALEYVENQTPKIVRAAVENTKQALPYVKDKSMLK